MASSWILGADLEKVVSSVDPLPALPAHDAGDLRFVKSGGWMGLVVLGAMDWGNPLVGCNSHDANDAPGVVPLLVGGIKILPLPSTSESRVKPQNPWIV